MTTLMRRLVNGAAAALIVLACIAGDSVSAGPAPSPASSKRNPCDSGLPQLRDDPNGYRLRGDRCEGVYIREVAGNTTLLVGSFTERFDEFEPSANASLEIAWAPLAGSVMHLRAQGLRHRLHYRMDAIRPGEDGSFVWPLGILAALQIKKSDVGIVGRTSHQVGNSVRDVYVPLRIGAGSPTRPFTRKLLLLPGEELTEVFITLATISPAGNTVARLRDGEALGRGYYPANRSIEVALTDLTAPGIYRLDVGATLRRGGSSTETVWLYLPR